jgi:hypothetical protein
MTVPDLLGRRALNRATLARQLLLGRACLPVPGALEHLVGLQAQAPDAPYVGLWSRLDEFRTTALARAVEERHVVRVPLMRATVHLVTAADCALLRPWLQPVLERAFAGQAFARRLGGAGPGDVVNAAAGLLAAATMTRAELGAALAGRWPEGDPRALAYAATYLLPVVQVPPRGIWGVTAPARWTLAESWTGRGPRRAAPGQLVLRYLSAFGPGTVRDMQTWSGLTRLQEVADRLGPAVRRFRDESGRELLDLPDAPRPSPDTPAPPRFLPEYDNVLLSHADRSRIIDGRRRVPLPPGNGGARGTLLVDGMFSGTWSCARSAKTATLLIETFGPLTAAAAREVSDEGGRLLSFVAPRSDPQVVLAAS